MHSDTKAVHAGRPVDPATAALTAPIHLSTTFERTADARYPLGYEYAREHNPNRHALETCLANSKMAPKRSASPAAWPSAMPCSNPWSPVITSSSPTTRIWGLRKLATLHRHLRFTLVDLTNPEAFEAAVTPQTRLIWPSLPAIP